MSKQAKVIKPRLCDYCREIIETDADGLVRHSMTAHRKVEKIRPMGKPAARRLVRRYLTKSSVM